MSQTGSKGAIHRWLYQPKRMRWRQILFKVHYWSGLVLGLYILFISVTGSVLVYRNELYVWLSPDAPLSLSEGPLLTDEILTERATNAYPGYRIDRIRRPQDNRKAVDIWLGDSLGRLRKRYFNPHTGEDMGSSAAIGYRAVTGLINLHKQFLAGPTGRTVNGFGALAILLVTLSGLVIWWPGIRRWKQSLMMHRNTGWRRRVWELHSMTGFWCFGFLVIFSVSGMYLCFPQTFHAAAEWLQPLTVENAGSRLVDDVLYWLAFLHFGRINGIGLPCDGPGICDQTVKATWALFGLAPAVMIVSGLVMWWNRVVRRHLKKAGIR